MSLVIFCLLFSFVDYVSVKGEIIRYLSLTDQYVSLFFKISNFILYSSIFLLHFASFLFFFILYFKFYILTFFTLFLILILIISPPSALSKSFFFPLLIFFFPFLYLYSHSTFIIFVHYYLCYINLCSFLVDIAVVVEGYFCWCEFCFLVYSVLFCQHLHNRIQDMVGTVTLSQPAGGERTSERANNYYNPVTIREST